MLTDPGIASATPHSPTKILDAAGRWGGRIPKPSEHTAAMLRGKAEKRRWEAAMRSGELRNFAMPEQFGALLAAGELAYDVTAWFAAALLVVALDYRARRVLGAFLALDRLGFAGAGAMYWQLARLTDETPRPTTLRPTWSTTRRILDELLALELLVVVTPLFDRLVRGSDDVLYRRRPLLTEELPPKPRGERAGNAYALGPLARATIAAACDRAVDRSVDKSVNNPPRLSSGNQVGCTQKEQASGTENTCAPDSASASDSEESAALNACSHAASDPDPEGSRLAAPAVSEDLTLPAGAGLPVGPGTRQGETRSALRRAETERSTSRAAGASAALGRLLELAELAEAAGAGARARVFRELAAKHLTARTAISVERRAAALETARRRALLHGDHERAAELAAELAQLVAPRGGAS